MRAPESLLLFSFLSLSPFSLGGGVVFFVLNTAKSFFASPWGLVDDEDSIEGGGKSEGEAGREDKPGKACRWNREKEGR